MDKFGLILKIVWSVLKFIFRKSDAKEDKVNTIQKEMDDAFKIKDKAERVSKVNNLINRINRL